MEWFIPFYLFGFIFLNFPFPTSTAGQLGRVVMAQVSGFPPLFPFQGNTQILPVRKSEGSNPSVVIYFLGGVLVGEWCRFNFWLKSATR